MNSVAISKIPLLDKCPASWSMGKRVPKSDTFEANEGTMAHDALERAMTFGDVRVPDLDQYDLDGKADAVRYANEYAPVILDRFDGAERHVESPVALQIDKDVMIRGRLDYVARQIDGTVVGLDYKYGQWMDVSAEGNLQLLIGGYAFEPSCTAVHGVIIQPRVDTDIDEYSWSEPQEAVRAVFDRIRDAVSDDPTFCPGEHCRWCDARPICPAFRTYVEDDMKRELDKADTESLAKSLEVATALTKYGEQVRKLAREIGSEQKIPGWKLVRGRRTIRWVDDVDGIGKAFEEKGIDPWTLKSPAALGKEAMQCGEEIDMDALTVASNTASLVVKDSDKRESLSPEDPIDVFFD